MEFQICTRCVMDTSDPEITFNEAGICNHCIRYDVMFDKVKENVSNNMLDVVVDKIKRAGRGKEYDCIIGVSGGVDSTFVAWKVKQLGLRPLAVHLDNGWNDELAVNNIENTLKKLNIDLFTHVIDWEEFKRLQLAFIKASVPDLEIPTDHAIAAILYKTALKHDIRYVILGNNTTTEAIMPRSWSYGHHDVRYIKDINRRFGGKRLRTFPMIGLYTLMALRLSGLVRVLPILDYINYDKGSALATIEKELGWRDYGGKHHESIYTRFYQSYILPNKFGIDKRKAHLSALICSGQLERSAALEALKSPPCEDVKMKEDKVYVAKKFGLTVEEFDQLMALPSQSYSDYHSYDKSPIIRGIKSLYHKVSKI